MDRDQRIEELFDQYRNRRSSLADLQRRMQAVSVTAVSARREVSVTVSHAGLVTAIGFPSGAYRRLAPQELASLLMDTIEDAKERAATEAAEVIAPMLPGGLDVKALMRGRVDLDQPAPGEPRMPPAGRGQIRR